MVFFKHRRNFFIKGTAERLQSAPKNSMMHKQHLAVFFDSHIDRGLTQIDGEADFFYFAGILDLQAVESIGRVAYGRDVQKVVQIMAEL